MGKEYGYTTYHYTPGTMSNADYTTPDMGANTVAVSSSMTKSWR